MKYTVTAFVDDKDYVAEVKIRHGAKNRTIFNRCMNDIGRLLIKDHILQERALFNYDLPSIWTNGYLGAAWFVDPYIPVSIQEETGAWLAN